MVFRWRKRKKSVSTQIPAAELAGTTRDRTGGEGIAAIPGSLVTPKSDHRQPYIAIFTMATFILPTGRQVEKDAAYCVSTKARGRWSTKFFKSFKGADNEYKSVRAHLRNPDMVAYYDLQEVKLIKPEA